METIPQVIAAMRSKCDAMKSGPAKSSLRLWVEPQGALAIRASGTDSARRALPARQAVRNIPQRGGSMKDYLAKHIEDPDLWYSVGNWVEHENFDIPDVAVIDPTLWGHDPIEEDEARAVACLVAAAPRMLMTLKVLRYTASLNPDMFPDEGVADLIDRAIESAEAFRYGIRHAIGADDEGLGGVRQEA